MIRRAVERLSPSATRRTTGPYLEQTKPVRVPLSLLETVQHLLGEHREAVQTRQKKLTEPCQSS